MRWPLLKQDVIFISGQLLLSCLLASCGFFEQKSHPTPDEEIKPQILGEPLIWSLQDRHCNAKSAVAQLSSQVRVWVANQKGQIVQENFDFSAFSGQGLESPLIDEAIILSQEMDISADYRKAMLLYPDNETARLHQLSHDFSQRVFQSPSQEYARKNYRKLYFCRKNGGYRRDSLENVALATLVGLQKAYVAHEYQKALEDKKAFFIPQPLAKIKLLVHPLFHRRIKEGQSRYKKYFVDNAFWERLELAGKHIFLIVMLPHHKQTGKLLKQNYWEQPYISAHEYGHHLFSHYHQALSLSQSSQLEMTIAGFNEGFSDLIAHISLASSQELYQNIALDGNIINQGSRNILDPQISILSPDHAYIHTASKVLSKNFLDVYLDKLPGYAKAIDESSIIKEAHYFGAIIAYIFNQLLNQHSYFRKHPLAKLPATLAWARSLTLLAKQYHLRPEAFLEKAMLRMAQVACGYRPNALTVDHLDPEEQSLCGDKLAELLPVYYEKWQRNTPLSLAFHPASW